VKSRANQVTPVRMRSILKVHLQPYLTEHPEIIGSGTPEATVCQIEKGFGVQSILLASGAQPGLKIHHNWGQVITIPDVKSRANQVTPVRMRSILKVHLQP
jgi:hypothetical protein